MTDTTPLQNPMHLPAPLTPLVGREQERAVLLDLLRRNDVRLVTLTGAGGVGKTRLALAMAEELATAPSVSSGRVFADGVQFVPLAAVREPGLLLPTIAKALGLHETGDRSLEERLPALLREREHLLVLDNFEHLVEAASIVPWLLSLAPRLTILATSRALLRVSGEHDLPVLPLASVDPTRALPLEVVAGMPAVQLFVARARAVVPGFTLENQNAAAVAAICHRLDGLPLAIELAATRIRHLPPAALLERLGRRLPLLTGGARDLPERQQTMRDAIAWSYDLLSPEEQALFRRLAVFVGGFTLEAAEAVASEGEEARGREGGDDTSVPALAPSRLPAFDGVASLIDKSLVRQDSGPDGTPRYTMLETIREFGLEQLSAHGEIADVHRRHARHFLALIQGIDPDLNEGEQAVWFSRLDHDRPNLQAAAAWFLDQDDAESALEMAAAPWQYWEMRGYLAEGRDWLQRALALPGSGDPAIRAAALWRLGYFCFDLGDHDEALIHLEQSLALYEAVGHRRGEATALNALGLVTGDQSDLTRAQAYHEQALALRRELGDKTGIAISLGNLGNVAAAQGRLAEARAHHEESLALRLELGQPRGIAYQSVNTSNLAYAEGRLGAAQELLRRGLAIFEELGDQIGTAFALRVLGAVTVAAGELARGIEYYRQAIELHRQLNLLRGVVVCITDVAYLTMTVDAGRATRLLGAVQRLRAATGTKRPPSEQPAWDGAVAAMRSALGAARFAENWQAGEALILEQIIAEALETLQTLTSRPEPIASPPASESGLDLLGFTIRERDVLRLLSEGASNRAIADALFIGVPTVKNHVTAILTKLGVDSRGAAVAQAHRRGLV